MKRTEEGCTFTFGEIDLIGGVLDICRNELHKRDVDLSIVAEGLERVLDCLAVCMPE